MARLTISQAESLARKLRADADMGETEPINVKTLLRKFHIQTMFRPLSDSSYGISIKTDRAKFMLVNSNSTIGRQHFTIAHELYHLFFDEHPEPHMCKDGLSGAERNANLFASALLMPATGLLQEISESEIKTKKINMATILRLEHLYGVSRQSLLYRLKDIKVITEEARAELSLKNVMQTAMEYGYDTSLYKSGNKGVSIGDFGEKAKFLYDCGKISEGHYVESLNMLRDAREED